MRFVILAPGPSMSQDLADSLRAENVIAVGNCFELAPWAKVLVSSDAAWWDKHPGAESFGGARLSAGRTTKAAQCPGASTSWNSGVLALEVARLSGATEIHLYGVDMHGTHFFGPYTNGLRNTSDQRRRVHMKQYADWGRNNPGIKVVNRTPGSSLQCFPFE